MLKYEVIEKHYVDNRQKMLKKLTFLTGGHHQAEDVLQESYYRALKYSDSCREGEFNRWFSMIVTNCLNDFRKEESGLSYLEENEDLEELINSSITSDQAVKEIYKRIQNKNEISRHVLTLHVGDEYSVKDISKVTPYSYSQIHKIVQRFREEVRKMYE